MKLFFKIIIVSILPLCNVFSQSNEIEWVKTISTNPPDANTSPFPLDLWTDAEGNTVVIVNFDKPIRFDNGITVANNTNEQQYAIVKYNSLGGLLWFQTIRGEDAGTPSFIGLSAKICGDQQGNTYVLGSFSTQKVFFGTATSITKSCVSCEELFLVKYDSNGLVLWVKTFISDGIGSNKSIGIDTDLDGNLYVAGINGSNTMNFGTYSFPNLNNRQQFIAKISPNGNLIWSNSPIPVPGVGTSFVSPILFSVSDNGTIYVAGSYSPSKIDFGNGVQLDIFSGFNDYLAQYNSNGVAQWAKNFNNGNIAEMNDIDAIDDERVLVTFNGLTGIRSGNINIVTGNSLSMAVLLQCSKNAIIVKETANFQDVTSYPFNAVVALPYNEYYTGGYFQETISLGTTNLEANICVDGLLVKNRENGSSLPNIYQFGENGCEYIYSTSYSNALDADQMGNTYFVGGLTEGGSFGGSLPNVSAMFLAKRSSPPVSSNEANTQQAKVFPNPNTGSFQVQFGAIPQNTTLVLTDIMGKAVYRTSANTSSIDLHLDLPNGLYLMQYLDRNQLVTVKIVVANP
jgi:hypothetical protein